MAAPKTTQQRATKRSLIDEPREFLRDDFCDIQILPFTCDQFETALSPQNHRYQKTARWHSLLENANERSTLSAAQVAWQ
jgi:hypothetical protein